MISYTRLISGYEGGLGDILCLTCHILFNMGTESDTAWGDLCDWLMIWLPSVFVNGKAVAAAAAAAGVGPDVLVAVAGCRPSGTSQWGSSP